MRKTGLRLLVAGLLGIAGVSTSFRTGAQSVVPVYQPQFRLDNLGGLSGNPTQMAFGPDGRLYIRISNAAGGVSVDSYAYDKTTGAISDQKHAFTGPSGIGIAFHQNHMYLTTFAGDIIKLDDENGNGVWGEAGELNVHIVTGIPQGDHNIDQLQIKGNTLYVGVGRRTINGFSGAYTSGSLDDFGGKGFWSGGTGTTWGDCAYGGTICWIQDLTQVVDTDSSANAYSDPTINQHLVQQDTSPYTVTASNKLIIHSAGTRNPFGLCLDRSGELWFTVNFNRTKTNGDGTSGFGYFEDSLGPDFSKDVHDQLFHASLGADYGYHDSNWRGVMPYMDTTWASYHRVLSTTFDNSFNTGPYTLTDPANPDGLGPSSSSDGCGFFYPYGLPSELTNNIFIARYNGPITDSQGIHTLDYRDLVAVDTSTGKVRRIASGFNNPLCVLWDGGQRLLIGNYGDSTLDALVVKNPTVSLVANAAGAAGQTVSLRALLRRLPDAAFLAGKTLTFKIDGTVVGSAVTTASPSTPATLSYTIPATLTPGNHTLSVAFAGDSGLAPSAQTATLAVHFNTRLTLANATATAGQSVLLRSLLRRYPDAADVSGKTITFQIDGAAVGTATTGADGLASLTYTVPASLAPGGHVLSAAYAGDSSYFAASATGVLGVHFNTQLKSAPVSGKVGQSVLLRGLLRRYPDAADVSGKTITFQIDGAAVGTATTGADGLASLHYVLPKGTSVGSHTLGVVFAGDAGYNASAGTATLTVTGP